MRSGLPRSVRLLGWTSLFTDAATEAIYPLLPVFLTRVLGATPVSLGIIEGAADAVSSVLKVIAGRISDRTGRRKPLVVAGYAIAGFVRPLIALASTWQHVFAVRVTDRIGKGLRGAPRDAMLGALAPPGERGRVFGYHRAMDHSGAVVGPILATVFLWNFPGQYRALFALALIPGLVALTLLLFVPDVTPHGAASEPRAPAPGAGAAMPRSLKRFLFILSIFTLGNSTDAFLLLRLADAGLATMYVPLAWAALHVVKASLSTRGGRLSDVYGRVRLIAGGWIVYAAVYAGMAIAESLTGLLVLFLIYGVYYALVEGSEKALVADLTPSALHGTAFGWYNAVLGLGALAASLLFGAIWEGFGPPAAFLTGAALALVAAGLLAADRPLARPVVEQ
jgi:MFS family permease